MSLKEKISAMPEKAREILTAALPIFADKGYYQTTIYDIAHRAGIAKGTIYLYFSNKEDLYLNLLLFVSHQINEGIRKKIQSVEDTWEKLNIAMDIHFSNLIRFKSHYLVTDSTLAKPFREAEAFRLAKIEHIKIYEEILEQHFRKLGLGAPFSLRTAALIITGGLTSYARFHFLKDYAPSPAEYLQVFKQIIRNALVMKPSRMNSPTTLKPKRGKNE